MEEGLTSHQKQPWSPRIKVELKATLAPKSYHSLHAAVSYEADVDDILNVERNRDIRAAMREMMKMAEADIAGQLGVAYEEMKEEAHD